MKRIINLFVLCVFAVCFLGCGSIKIKEDVVHDPAVQAFALTEAGYNASYWVLKNNPDYIEQVEAGLWGIEKLLEAGDITEAVGAAIDVVATFQAIDLTYLHFISSASRLLSMILEVDLEAPENYEQAKTFLRAFLVGARAGIADAKFINEERKNERKKQ